MKPESQSISLPFALRAGYWQRPRDPLTHPRLPGQTDSSSRPWPSRRRALAAIPASGTKKTTEPELVNAPLDQVLAYFE